MKRSILLTLAAIIFAGAGFAGGMRYESYRISKMSPQELFSQIGGFGARTAGPNDGAGNQVRFERNDNIGWMITGEIISKDDKSITVKLLDGGSRIIFYSSSTTISKTVDGKSDDLAVGKNVMISGDTNADNTINAKNIQLRADLPVPLASPSPSK